MIIYLLAKRAKTEHKTNCNGSSETLQLPPLSGYSIGLVALLRRMAVTAAAIRSTDTAVGVSFAGWDSRITDTVADTFDGGGDIVL